MNIFQGSLRVANGVTLNRETTPVYNLLVTATNDPNDPSSQQPKTTVSVSSEYCFIYMRNIIIL